MHAFSKTFAELTLALTEVPFINATNITRAADLVSHAAMGHSPNRLAAEFLGFVFSPVLPYDPLIEDMILTAADALASSVTSDGAAGSSSVEATRILLIAISKKSDLADATCRAIDAIKIDEPTSILADHADDGEPIEIFTPGGTACLDCFENRYTGIRWYRIALRPFERGGRTINLDDRHYPTAQAAKDALKRIFTPQDASKSAAA